MHDYSVLRSIGHRRQIRYDLNVMALFHLQGHYRTRAEWFKTLGLVNRGTRRVHVTAVCSAGDGPLLHDLVGGWPINVDATLLEMASVHPIPKLNGAYLWLRDNPIRCRWVLRVDDDSVTDVDRLLAQNDLRFGDAPVHVMSSPFSLSDQMASVCQEYLLSQAIEAPLLEAEHEAGLTSSKGLTQIFQSKAACDFLEFTAKTLAAPGDRCLAIAARIADVPTTFAVGMDKAFLRDRMSLTGGDLHHIHYVDWNDERFREMLWAFEYGTVSSLSPAIHLTLRGTTVEFGRAIGLPLNSLTLSDDGRILHSRHQNEWAWDQTPGGIAFRSDAGRITTAFTHKRIGRDRAYILGSSLTSAHQHYISIANPQRLA